MDEVTLGRMLSEYGAGRRPVLRRIITLSFARARIVHRSGCRTAVRAVPRSPASENEQPMTHNSTAKNHALDNPMCCR